jgi:flagellar hook-basal body complex protein FliE
MSDMNVNMLLAQMRTMEAQAQAKPEAISGGEITTQKTDFSNLLKQSIDSVNETSMTSAKMADAFEKGGSDVSLAQLMISMEKANVSFQAMTQVRNKLLTAYQEIMNMPV